MSHGQHSISVSLLSDDSRSVREFLNGVVAESRITAFELWRQILKYL